jgi:hypothetical protein
MKTSYATRLIRKSSGTLHFSALLTRATFVLLVSFFGVAVSFAQVDAGAILGTVRDTSNAVIPGVKVTLTNEDTGVVQEVMSSSTGEYIFAPVKIGTYSVVAEFHGFQRVDHPHVTVNVQQRVLVDFVLPPGEMTQTVSVTGEAPLLQSEDASVGQVIGARTINDLPLNGRNFTFLAQLSAGVTFDQQDTRGLGATGSFAANGLRPAQNNYLLDGIDNNVNLVDFLNGTAYVVKPPVDAIAEFKMQTDNYSAEAGRSAGAILNATIKSGTNEFHGNAWEFLRNDAFDAANFFENAGGIPKGEYRQNQFGATFGGPIRKNKTFFFMDYEGTRIRQASPSLNTVPTLSERNSGYTNLSQLLTQGGSEPTDVLGRNFALGQVFDPSTTRAVSCGVPDPVTGITPPCPSGTSTGSQIGFAREPFQGNIIPANRLDPNAIKLLNLYPLPTNSSLFNNYAADPVISNNPNQFDVRVDQSFSEKDSVFARVSYVNNPIDLPGPFPGLADGGAFYQGIQTAISNNDALSETHTFSPSLINEARLGFNRIHATRVQPFANDLGAAAQYGIQGVPNGPSNGGLGSFFITGLTTLGSNEFLPSIEYSNTLQFTDNLTKNLGRQSIKVGFEYQHLRFSILQPPEGRGYWNFTGVYTEVPESTGGNTGLAQMLLTPIPGTVAGASNYVGGADSVGASNIANTDQFHNYDGAYFQDDIKITSKLTLNLGLRWEYFGQLGERYGAQSNFQASGTSAASEFILSTKRCNTPLSPDFLAAAQKDNIDIVCSSLTGLGKSQLTNFSPRVGFAYQLTPKFVVRGGYGIFYGGFENSVVETYVDFPFQFSLNYPNLVPNAPITFPNGSIATLETGLTGIPLSPANVEPAGVSFTGEDFHTKTPYTQGFNLTLQYQVTPNQTVQLGYVGNNVHHLGVYTNRNSPTEILTPGLDSYNYSPYPDFQTGFTDTSYAGDSYYNSLQANYERRFSAGLSVLANFTYSKCRTDAVDVLNGTAITGFRGAFLPGFGIQGDYGLCDFDIPKVVHVSGDYELPFGHGRQFLNNSSRAVDMLLGGWSTNWILTLQDGQPFTVGCSGASTTSGFGCDALEVPGESITAGPHNVNHWINPAAFATPPVATAIGQSNYAPLGGAPSQFYGPGFHRMDFSAFKTFPVTEKTKLEFRAEIFNLTNHPDFSPPGFSGNGVVAAPGSLNYLSPSTFGVITSTRDGLNDQREIQFALKFYY